MQCRYCGAETQNGALFCHMCGKPVGEKKTNRKRGNGEGTVYKRGEKYIAERTVGWYIDPSGKLHRRAVRKTFAKKKDAVAALPTLSPRRQKNATFQALYTAWFDTLTTGKSTQNCYSAAMRYFEPLYHLPISDVDVDDLQECLDNCPRGRRTKENMRAALGLMYKYGIPRGYLPEKINLAAYLKINGEKGSFESSGLPDAYLKAIREAVGVVEGADLILAHCYLGFRPSEFLSLTQADYDEQEKVFFGGAKTEAGINRAVTVSPKIQGIVDAYAGKNPAQFFCAPDGAKMDIKKYRDLFYTVLEQLDLDNPVVVENSISRHRYTPHSCRHTFATMMKRVEGNSADKLRLIGHTTDEMLRHYQDSPVADLRVITDKIG